MLTLIKPDSTSYDSAEQSRLAPYFDIGQALDSDLQQWFRNLRRMAQHDLSIAHCVQHSQAASLSVHLALGDHRPAWTHATQRLGAYVGWKSMDTLKYDGYTLDGVKHWISMLDRCDYVVTRVHDAYDRRHFMLLDLTSDQYASRSWSFEPIGMLLARPGTLHINQMPIENYQVLGQTETRFAFRVSSFVDYGFITNYLGLTEALYGELLAFLTKHNMPITLEVDKIDLALASLRMMWEDNLTSVVNQGPVDDHFWHRRNTQYAQSKRVLIDTITQILELGSSYFFDAHSEFSRRFRDAIMLSTHMQSLYRNTQDMIFVK